MKKTVTILSLIVSSLLITGCGCSNSEKTKTLKCSTSVEEYNEKTDLTATFKDDYLSKLQIKTIVSLSSEDLASAYYEIYMNSEDEKVTKESNNVIFEKEETFEEKIDINKYDKYLETLEKQGYKCN